MRKEGFLRQTTTDVLIANHKNLTAISVFTGAGGDSLGLSRAGFTIRVMVEQNKGCCDTLRANWFAEELLKRPDLNSMKDIKKRISWYRKPEPVIIQEDITKVTTEEILKAGNLEIGEATLVSGGSPCQGFSSSGKRQLDDPRNRLIWEYWRVIDEAMPKLFFFENVPGMVWGKNYPVMLDFSKRLADSGYNVTWDILNAADFGVPQNRKRVIMIGKRIDMAALIDGRIQYTIACMPGEIKHPEWFNKKHKLKKKNRQLELK